MPPRYAYWTILIDATPTSFRSRDREDLVPTAHQLRRTNPSVEIRWFAHGRLWDTPEQAEWARRHAPKKGATRGPEWRPGGAHKDPRARFARGAKRKERPAGSRQERPAGSRQEQPSGGRPPAARGRIRKGGHRGPRKPRP